MPKFSNLDMSNLEVLPASSTRLHEVVFLYPWLLGSGPVLFESWHQREGTLFSRGGACYGPCTWAVCEWASMGRCVRVYCGVAQLSSC